MHYVCADIHGRWEKYQAMLDGLNLGPEDRLYILGDVIDRGPDGIRILQDIRIRGNVVFFMGNHELFLLSCICYGIGEWMESWLNNGGRTTAEAFLELSSEEQDEILEFLEDSYIAMPDLVVGNCHYYLVHAFPDLHYMEKPVLFREIGDEERLWNMLWKRVDDSMWEGDQTVRTVSEEGKKLIIGHTITTRFCRFNCDAEGRARIHHDKYFIGLDCGCARVGERACLGVLRLEDGKEFYF